jgi:hypothetical protein
MGLALRRHRLAAGIVLLSVHCREPDTFRSQGGVFRNEYVSGVLTTQKSFFQKYGYFEIRAKIPLGIGVCPAFWLLANDGGCPLKSSDSQHDFQVSTNDWRLSR